MYTFRDADPAKIHGRRHPSAVDIAGEQPQPTRNTTAIFATPVWLRALFPADAAATVSGKPHDTGPGNIWWGARPVPGAPSPVPEWASCLPAATKTIALADVASM
ncbi:MAG TPA: hypothetical protein VFR67_17940 [Pilimelia sp.]|nr:hypothetical protein [Pilimelia sp.]